MAHNAAEMPLVDSLRSLFLTIILCALLNISILLLIKNPFKAALLTTLILVLFFSYGHLNLLLRNWNIFAISLGRHRVLIPLYTFILVIGATLILVSKRELTFLSRFLNVFSVVLLIFPMYQIGIYWIQDSIAQRGQENNPSTSKSVFLSPNQIPRDVYYILTDGYPRHDFIQRFLDYDNSDFLKQLSARGFYVAECSQSNYTDTRFAMASTLNMVYLDNGTGASEVVFPGAILDNMIRSGIVQQNFSALDYQIITFESGYKWLRWQDTDVHLDPAVERSRRTLSGIRINDFEYLLLNTTAAKFLLDLPFVLNPTEANRIAEILNSPRASHRDRVFFALDYLPEMSSAKDKPVFVYGHIIFPHPPFIVNADGKALRNSPENELAGYGDQIAYLDTRLIEIIDQLIANTDPDPIIIIQGDHGATIEYKERDIDLANRLGILNAYYLPAGEESLGEKNGDPTNSLYPRITPVNTFRLIFDQYFNGQYGLLPDKSIIGRQSPFTELPCPTKPLNIGE